MPIAVPTLSVTDNQDGTATFIVSGGDPSATNLIRYSRLEMPGWIDITTINGNGSATVPAQLGLRWFAAFSTLLTETVVSAPTPAIITPSPTAIFEQCIQSVVTTLQGAASLSQLGPITTDQVKRQDVIDLEHLGCALPAIVVTPGLQETQDGGTNASDDIDYPVLVAVVDRKDEHDPANTPTYFYWREVIRQLFNNKRLPGVPSSYRNVVNFEIALDHKQDDEEMNQFSTALRVNCKARELRWT